MLVLEQINERKRVGPGGRARDFCGDCIGGLWRMGGRSKCLVKVVNEINQKSQLVRRDTVLVD